MLNQQKYILSTAKLEAWFHNNPLGRNILSKEYEYYNHIIPRIFGYHALQFGYPSINFLQNNKINYKYIVGKDIQTDILHLPFCCDSIDLIIYPHNLEWLTKEEREIALQECYRVLSPNGRIIISAFSNQSLFKFFLNKIHTNCDFIDIDDLQQELHRLNFTIDGGRFLSYTPPINNQKILSNLSFLEKVGDRWYPTLANVFILVATKSMMKYSNIQTPDCSLWYNNSLIVT